MKKTITFFSAIALSSTLLSASCFNNQKQEVKKNNEINSEKPKNVSNPAQENSKPINSEEKANNPKVENNQETSNDTNKKTNQENEINNNAPVNNQDSNSSKNNQVEKDNDNKADIPNRKSENPNDQTPADDSDSNFSDINEQPTEDDERVNHPEINDEHENEDNPVSNAEEPKNLEQPEQNNDENLPVRQPAKSNDNTNESSDKPSVSNSDTSKQEEKTNHIQESKTPKFESSLSEKFKEKTIFVRPPYGASFAFNDKSLQLPNITAIFDHLDSPGQSKSSEEHKPSAKILESNTSTSSKDLNKQGVNEISEFLAVPSMMKYYLQLGNPNDFVIFGGDTNIKFENFYLQNHSVFDGVSKLFDNLTWKKSERPDQNFFTSLGTKNNYSNPYDKMFFINNTPSDLVVQTLDEVGSQDFRFKVNIIKGFYTQSKYKIWDKKELKKIANSKQEKKFDDGNDFSIIRNDISDHAPVYTDVKIKNKKLKTNVSVLENNPKGENTVRIGHWNILNFGGSNPLKSTAIGQLIAQVGMDIIGLTEVNNNAGTKVQEIVDVLNKSTGRSFKFVYQPLTENSFSSEWQAKRNFGNGQIEQVAIIYDSEIFKPIGFINNNNKVGYSFKEEIPYLAD
ncbi:hypothetical protein [Mycoplasma buteonis]|uniref:hypothetical protein n=1 Tax=Mycoplasma buteonis TaxID=171280 RepID=UPI0006909748|nr:hypothetical protein [Mycoplasma buteonis]